MMEVTPHLKNVLKNYQHSATKSLQGPGLALVAPKVELPSPESVKEEEFVPPPIAVQQLPILTTPDTGCSETTETTLEGQTISCFIVGGERRLCLPQVLNSVLRDFKLHQINQECDQLQIYCSRCTPEQLNVLKNQAILPTAAASSGLITKTDAERLCSALLHGQCAPLRPPPKGAVSFAVLHKCFGKGRGLCYPELYTNKNAKCIECTECQGGYSPQQFVCHVHRHFSENRTVHWGFDSANWRTYIRIGKEQPNREQCSKYLDDMKEQYDGKLPFPPPQNVYTGIKRKQILASELLKEQSLPLKKQKLGEYVNLNHLPYAMHQQIQQIYASLDPLYYIQEYAANRHLSAFKPVNNVHKDAKIHHSLIGINHQYATDPPVLQNPERVVPMSESERFGRTFQPNVALAPPPPKKHHRYGKSNDNNAVKNEMIAAATTTTTTTIKQEEEVVVKQEVDEMVVVKVKSPADLLMVTSKPVSVVQSTNNYNPDIELSTDTEDSASETSDKCDLGKVEDALKLVADGGVRERVLVLFRNLAKECRRKDDRIGELEARIRELEGCGGGGGGGGGKAVLTVKETETNAETAVETATTTTAAAIVAGTPPASSSSASSTKSTVSTASTTTVGAAASAKTTESATTVNGSSDKDDDCSSIIKSNCDQQQNEGQTSVIASLEQKAIINTAPE